MHIRLYYLNLKVLYPGQKIQLSFDGCTLCYVSAQSSTKSHS